MRRKYDCEGCIPQTCDICGREEEVEETEEETEEEEEEQK